MSSTDPREIPFEGVRVRCDSEQTYEALVAALLSNIGEKPVPVSELPATIFHDRELFATQNPSSRSPRLHAHALHRPRRMATNRRTKPQSAACHHRNPLIAITMIRHNLRPHCSHPSSCCSWKKTTTEAARPM